MEVQMIGTKVLIATTGYTGEDGFEIYLPAQSMMDFVTLLEPSLNSGELGWAGLAARDSLRLEAGYPLYGNELTARISPVQAGLSWSVDLNKSSFVGKDSLRAEKEGMIPGKSFIIKWMIVRFLDLERFCMLKTKLPEKCFREDFLH